MKEVRGHITAVTGISIALVLLFLFPATLTGNVSFLREQDDLSMIEFSEYFLTIDDPALLNYARTGKFEEKNCGWMGCPDCLFNTCFTGSIFKMDEDNGRVLIANYDERFGKLRKRAYCYMFVDEQKFITHEQIYDIIFERPIASHGWQTSRKPSQSGEWQGWRLFSWRNISALPIECLSAGIIEKWQAVPSRRAQAIEDAKEEQKEREQKRLGKKTQQGEFVPAAQIETPEPKEEDFLEDMITDLNVAE